MGERHERPSTKRALLVVELAQRVAGPVVGRLLTALGHTVVKVEPPDGDPLRGRPGRPGDAYLDAVFRQLNAGKLSVVHRAGQDADERRLAALLDRADLVVVDGTRRDGEALGVLGPARQERRRDLVTLSLTTFGLDCPWPGTRPDSLLGEAYGGLATMIGEPGHPPLSLGGTQAEFAAGFAGFYGAVASLVAAADSGVGDVVDVAVADVAAYMDWKSDLTFAETGIVQTRTGTAAGRWRIVRAADGWVGIVYQPDQWASLVRLVGDARLQVPELADESFRDGHPDAWWPVVEAWAAVRSRREIYDSAQAVGLAFGESADMGELLASPQNRSRGFLRVGDAGEIEVGALFQSAGLPWRTGRVPGLGADSSSVDALLAEPSTTVPARHGDPSRPPLQGMVVLDLGTITAGAATGRLLADLGATVVKVESPTRPDPFRSWTFPAARRTGETTGASPVFESNNAGKLGMALDLKVAADLEHFMALARDADVLLENFSVGVTGRLGIDPAAVRRVNPDLVYLSLSSQGQDGPESRYRSYGSTLDLLSGLASVTGYAGGGPVWSSADVNYPDQLVSLLGAGMVAYAWWSGRGAAVDISQREVVTWTLGGYLGEFAATGRSPGPTSNERPGALVRATVACRPHEGRPRWLAVSVVTPEEVAGLCGCLGVPTGGPSVAVRSSDVADRLATWAADLDVDKALARLRAYGVPCAAVLDSATRAADEHFTRRRVFLQDPARRKGFPFLLERRPPPDPAVAPPFPRRASVEDRTMVNTRR